MTISLSQLEAVPDHPDYAARIATLEDFAARLDLRFEDARLLFLAFVNRSSVNEQDGPRAPLDNERLEFLGDAILAKLVSEKLYHRFPQCQEGELTQMRAQLIRRETLSAWAAEMNLGNCLILGRGSERDGAASSRRVLANTFEALLGAIYLDQGETAARRFLERWLLPALGELADQGLTRDTKSELQELVQRTRKITPRYECINVSGPEHHREFVVQVTVAKEVWGVGSSTSMKDASFQAAGEALRRWHAAA